jgi:SAM-dependent methyltransferase
VSGPGRKRPGRYDELARSYDLTRGASPTVVRSLSTFLGPPQGRRLLDLAGGTGNYAQVLQARGFDVRILDANDPMLRRSIPKIGPGNQVVGDAAMAPFRDRSFDCATLVQALHLLRPEEQVRALSEARRVIRDGPFVLQAFTRENMQTMFVFEYFPGWDPPEWTHPSAEETMDLVRQAGFQRVERATYVYLDTADANLIALHTDPLRLAGPAYLRNNSGFARLPEEVKREGLARLAEDLRSGVLERRVKESFQVAVRNGHGTVFAAWP